MQPRSLLIFEESIKSKVTRLNYKDHLLRFLKFSKIKDYDSLLKLNIDQLQEILEDYVIHLKNTVNPNSVPVYMTGVKHFFIMNRTKIFWEIIQKMYPQRVKYAGQRAWSDEQIRKMLEFNTSRRNKAIIHFMASTGSRIGVHNYKLQMQHIRDVGDNVKAILIYAGEHDEYWTFLTPEASKSLEDYFEERQKNHEKFYPDSPIFRTRYSLGIEKTIQLGRNAVISMIFRTINKAGLTRTRVNRNFDIQMDHGFRKRFNIILKLNNDLNSNIAEKIMGHSTTIQLDERYLPRDDPRVFDKCVSEFKKAILDLTLDDSTRKQAELDKAKSENSKLDEIMEAMEQLKEEQKRMEKAADTERSENKKIIDNLSKKLL